VIPLTNSMPVTTATPKKANDSSFVTTTKKVGKVLTVMGYPMHLVVRLLQYTINFSISVLQFKKNWGEE
jgi:hypothetical protein